MKFLLFILGLLILTESSAGVYKCTDASGKKIYRASPCGEGQSKVELNVKTGGSKDLVALEKEQALTKQEEELRAEQKKLAEEQEAQKLAQLKQDAINESAKNQFVVKSNPQRYSAFAIPPYKYDDLSTLVKPYQNRLPDIERMRRQAAERGLATNQCGRVESVELSEKSTKEILLIVVNCSSAKEYIFSEQELNGN